MAKNITKIQHYVPQFYLKDFLMPDNALNVYLFKHHKFIRTPTKAVFNKKYFYDTKRESDVTSALDYQEAVVRLFGNRKGDYTVVHKRAKKDPQFIEHVLGNLEHESSIIFRRIFNDNNGIILQRPDVRVTLLLFIKILQVRSRNHYNDMASILSQEKSFVNKLYKSSPKGIHKAPLPKDSKEMQAHELLCISPEEVLRLSREAQVSSFSLVENNHKLPFVLGDDPAWRFGMKDFLLPISHYKGILIRQREFSNGGEIYKSAIHRHNCVTLLSKHDIQKSNLIQFSGSSEMLTGYKTAVLDTFKVANDPNKFLKLKFILSPR